MPSPFEHRTRPGETTPLRSTIEQSLQSRVRERRTWVARSSTALIIFGLVVLGQGLFRRAKG